MRQLTMPRVLALLLIGLLAVATQAGAASSQRLFLPLLRAPGIADEKPIAVANPDGVLTPGPIAFPANAMIDVQEYGAKSDGTTDDTAAIQRALNDTRVDENGLPLHSPPDAYNGRPRALFFPAGTYLVADTLSWVGCCMTLQGQGAGATTIRLKPNAAGFGDPSKPRPIIRTESGNMSFRQNIWDMAIVVGAGNPGAIGLDYISNNSGALQNVLIKAEDGRGVAGLEMLREWPGPNMFSRVQIEGFDYGIRVQFIEYSQTYENIVLKNQRVAGIRNGGAVMTIRGLYSQNRVPAIVHEGEHGLLTLLDGRLEGGGGTTSAIVFDSAKQNTIYLRDVAAQGYQSLLKNGAAIVAGTTESEYYSAKAHSLFSASPKAAMLRLPIRNTPTFGDSNIQNWALATCNGYEGCQLRSELQGLLDGGASTVAFPFGVRIVYDELTVTVPASVRRIIGFTSVFNGGGKNGGGVRFVVEGGGSEPLIIEQFGYGVKVEHRGSRAVVLKYGQFQYTAQPGAGDLYAEDAQMDGFTVQASQRVWGRQINNEYREGTKITNNGGTLWLLGMKTEGSFTVLETRGGSSEYLGGLIYPATDRLQPGEIAFRASGGARLALLYANITYTTRNYDIQVEEQRGADARRLLSSDVPARTRLFVSGP
ncbi:MAG: hypothetical protein H7Z42_02230 [Roseiflexaceae bacterium]|nr:hypothetical protein [Roseiflexaceae bacterium]